MDFREVEDRFEELKSKLDAGELDERAFEAQLRTLQVLDEQGRYWMIGAQSGLWYYYDGTQWIQSEPPEEAVPAPTKAPPPKPPSAPPPIQARPATAGPPGKGRAPRLVIPVVIALVAVCCIFAAASVVASEFILPSRPLSTFVVGLIGRAPSTPSPVATPQPSATLRPSAAEHIRVGDELFNEGRYEEAIAQYQMAISAEPQDAAAYSRLGQAHLQLGNCDQAIPEFQQALALDPNLESAQAGLMECGGALPPEVSFMSYRRSDLNFSLLYPSTWFVREEELQTIFAEREEDIDFLRGNIFFISSLPLAPDEEGMDSMGGLIKARQLINLPIGSQLGGVEIESLAGWDWATVRGEITGLEMPTTIYIAATVKDSVWYGIWAIGPSETWEQTSWPIFRMMADSVQVGQVVAEASPSAEPSPQVSETPEASPEASPEPTPTSGAATPTAPPGASPTPTPRPPTATPRPASLSGKIAYPVYLGGQDYQVRIATVGGSILQTIPNVSEPALSPDGARIAVRSWATDARALFLMSTSGGNPQRITNFLEDSVPRWAADGVSVVFGTKREGPHHTSMVYTYAPNRGESKLGEGDNPDWSPGGDLIVARGTVNATGLIAMDAVGGNRRQLTLNPTDSSPDWAPVGDKIAFMRRIDGNWDIWAINSDGTGETRLTSDQSIDGLPAWSPDGRFIAFLSNRNGLWAIWVMDSNGSGQRKLFNTDCSSYATGPFDGECDGSNCHQSRDWDAEQISWSP